MSRMQCMFIWLMAFLLLSKLRITSMIQFKVETVFNLNDTRMQSLPEWLYYKSHWIDLMDISLRNVVFSLVPDVPHSICGKVIVRSIHLGRFYKVRNANWPHTAKCVAEKRNGITNCEFRLNLRQSWRYWKPPRTVPTYSAYSKWWDRVLSKATASDLA